MRTGLVRSNQNKVISGVCGGIGEYFNIDPTIIRLGFVIATISGGAGILAYIVAFFIMPEGGGSNSHNFSNDAQKGFNSEYNPDMDFSSVMGDDDEYTKKDPQSNKTFIGICLIALGIIFLTKQYIDINLKILGPLLLVGIGALIVLRGGRRLP